MGLNVTAMKNEVTDLMKDIYYTRAAATASTRASSAMLSDHGLATRLTECSAPGRGRRLYGGYNVSFGSPAVGRVRYVDANGDGEINDRDRT